MEIFKKRPLCLILCIILGGFSFSVNSSLPVSLSLLILPLVIISLTFIGGVIERDKIILARIVGIALASSILLGMLFTGSFLPRDYYDEEIKIKATVTEAYDKDTYQKVIIETEEVNGDGKTYKLLYFNYGKSLKVGDYFEADAKIGSLEDNDEMKKSYYSDGISGVVEIENLKIIDTSKSGKTIFERSRDLITKRLIGSSGESSGGLMSALLIGDRSHLAPSLSLAFRRLGISHILALSGMHLAILSHAIERFLYFLRISKRKRMVATSLFTLSYMFIVGFTPSITRAGIMLLTYYSLHLLARTSDSLTSLSVAVFIIVICNPNSIFDISLWLSAFATLGIVSLTELRTNKSSEYSMWLSPIIYIRNSIISSFFAISLTLLLTVRSFSMLSPIAFISTALFSPIIVIFIYLGMLMPLLGWFIPIGKAVSILGGFIIRLSEWLSRPWWVTASTDYSLVNILTALITALFVAFLIFKIKHKKTLISAMVILLVAVMTISTVIYSRSIYDDRVIYTSNKTYDTVIITGDGDVSVIMSDSISPRSMNYITDAVYNEGVSKIDNLVFTGYPESFNSLTSLINYVRTDLIYVPRPQNIYEIELAERISNILSHYGTALKFYIQGERLEFSDVGFTLNYNSSLEHGSTFDSIYTLDDGQVYTTYISEGAFRSAPDNVLINTTKSDIWIFGVGSEKDAEFDLAIYPKGAIILGRDKKLDESYIEDLNERGIPYYLVEYEELPIKLK